MTTYLTLQELMEQPTTDEDPNYDQLKELLLKDEEASQSIVNLLKAINLKWPKYTKNHTLVYESLSLHESSFERPRAIVYGQRGNLILTFNSGEVSDDGHENLEIASFDLVNGHQFREVVFLNEPQVELKLKDQDIEEVSRNVIISRPNIETCTKCHGEPARPIWENYATWPGVYGSNDDILYRTNAGTSLLRFFQPNFVPWLKRRGDTDLIAFPKGDTERIGYIQYLKYRERNERYKQLTPIVSLEQVLPEQFFHLIDNMDFKVNQLRNNRTNGNINKVFNTQMARKIAEDLSQRPNARENAKMLLALSCGYFVNENRQKIISFNPSTQNAFHNSRAVYSEIRKEFLEMQLENEYRMDRNFQWQISDTGSPGSLRLSRLQKLVGDPPESIDDNYGHFLQQLAPMFAGLRLAGLDEKRYVSNLRRASVIHDGEGFVGSLPRALIAKFQLENEAERLQKHINLNPAQYKHCSFIR